MLRYRSCKAVQRMIVLVAVGIGIAMDGHSDIDADSDIDTDSDPGILRYHLCFLNSNWLRMDLAGPTRLIAGVISFAGADDRFRVAGYLNIHFTPFSILRAIGGIVA